jgi:hypothetical protein
MALPAQRVGILVVCQFDLGGTGVPPVSSGLLDKGPARRRSHLIGLVKLIHDRDFSIMARHGHLCKNVACLIRAGTGVTLWP